MTLYPDDNTLPNGEPEVGLHNGKFTNGDPTNGINPSRAWAPTQNLLLDLLEHSINEGMGSSDNTTISQLTNAIRLIIHPVGTIQMWSFPEADLPFGWYRCDGLAVRLSSAQGQTLQGLSASFRSAWNLVVDTSDADPANHTITRPNLIGEFLRGVDHTNRTVGSKEDWAIENITGFLDPIRPADPITYAKGNLFELMTPNVGIVGSGSWSLDRVSFDASRVVKTADETRPKNVGMTPAIFLNV